jgi:type IV pilus assembly protein PilB
MTISIDELKQLLVGSGFVSEPDFTDAVQSATDIGNPIEDVLIFRGLISDDALGQFISEHLGVPYVSLKHIIIPEDILLYIPEHLAHTYRMVPFAKEGNKLKIALEDPRNFEAIEFAKRQSGFTVIPYYASVSDIRSALGQYKRNIRADFDKVIAENVKRTAVKGNLLQAAEDLPVVTILDTILEYAIAERASDIHIETFSEFVVVRFRIDGMLRDMIKLPKGIEIAIVARVKILSNLKIDEHRIPQDGRYKFTIDTDMIALRISIIPGFFGENIVMRLLPENRRPLSLEELGFRDISLDRIKKNIIKPHGLILVTGPTGSGKSTTLYTILNILNTTQVKICTIEDPVEYGIERITQIQVNTKTGLDFASGLRSLLRHDPDIIMVGEIRDEETAEIAIHAALTGHLVLSTLHTNDSAGAVPRLLDMGVEGFLLGSTLNLVVAQRLVRAICQSCRTVYQPTDDVIQRVEDEFHISLKGKSFYKGKGCQECNASGYSGRIGIYEVLQASDEIRSMITKHTSGGDITQKAIEQGMTLMWKDGIQKVFAGMTTLEEVMRAVRET